jgi:DNA-directed RNA polymerase subunit alpha
MNGEILNPFYGIEIEKLPKRIDISYCDLSVRSCNLIMGNGIRYLDELVNVSSREMLDWKGFGKKSLYEIREFLAQRGLSLKDETVDPVVKNMVLTELPQLIGEIKSKVDEATRELRYLSLKLEQICIEATKLRKNQD